MSKLFRSLNWRQSNVTVSVLAQLQRETESVQGLPKYRLHGLILERGHAEGSNVCSTPHRK